MLGVSAYRKLSTANIPVSVPGDFHASWDLNPRYNVKTFKNYLYFIIIESDD